MSVYSMSTRIKLLLVAAALAVTMAFGAALPAFGANAPEGCTKERGTIQCPEQGKNENQPKFQQTTLKKGSVNSSHEEETVCNKPCPPGQFND
jgi:hypothetical protein